MKPSHVIFSSKETIFYIVMDFTKSCHFTLSGEWEKYKGPKSLIYHEKSKTILKK